MDDENFWQGPQIQLLSGKLMFLTHWAIPAQNKHIITEATFAEHSAKLARKINDVRVLYRNNNKQGTL